MKVGKKVRTIKSVALDEEEKEILNRASKIIEDILDELGVSDYNSWDSICQGKDDIGEGHELQDISDLLYSMAEGEGEFTVKNEGDDED